MLDQLMEIVKQQAQGSVVENNAVPNEQNDAVMEEARNSIFGGLQNMLANGQTTELAALLKGEKDPTQDSNTMNMLSGDFINNITQKLGIDSSAASGIAASLIPMVLSQLSSSAKDPNNNSIDFGSILSSLRGGSGNSGGLGATASSIGGMLGLDKDKDGDVDMSDLLNMFK